MEHGLVIMKHIKVRNLITETTESNREVLKVTIDAPEKIESIWFELDSICSESIYDATYVATLIPATAIGAKLSIEGSISRSLYKNSSYIQDIFQSWYPDEFIKTPPVVSKYIERDTPTQDTRGVAMFFSGGVDSFYTLKKNINEIDSIIFVKGFDIPLENEALLDSVEASIKQVALHYNKKLEIVKTNLRNFSNIYALWGYHYHGAALAAVGHLLAHKYKQIFISSTHTYQDVFPWGSSPLLDHLFSSELVRFVHDGSEASRFEKTKFISNDDFAINRIVVCHERIDMQTDEKNCSKCEKCLRTMIALEASGVLNETNNFKHEIELSRLKALNIEDENTISFVRENALALSGTKVPALKKVKAILDEHLMRYEEGEMKKRISSLSIRQLQRILVYISKCLARKVQKRF